MCGVAMDVPDMMLKGPDAESVFDGHAARMLSPGANMSGLSTPGMMELGPREENHDTTGAGLMPSKVLLYVKAAVDPVSDDDAA